MIPDPGRLEDRLQGLVGDALRAFSWYEHDAHEFLYVRPDLNEVYSPEDLEKGLDQVAIEGMGYLHFESLFDAGKLGCAIYRFEQAIMFQFPVDDFNGLFVSVDRRGPEEIDSIAETCLEELPSST